LLFNRSKDRFFYQTLTDATLNIVEAVKLFRENVETLQDKEQFANKMKDLESKGDEYTHLILQELDQTFVPPMDREDIMALAGHLDDVLDEVEACTARFVYFKIDTTTPYLIKFADNLEKCSHLLHRAFVALEKKEFSTIRKIYIEINELENEGDRLMRESVHTLFEEPVDLLNLIKMKEIYERLEDVSDTFEDLMDVMERVVMKYA
jgi:predicted phosphate transport protein (TIGR00153 family)